MRDIEKKCSKCGEVLLLGMYHKKKAGKFGVRSECKDCRVKYYDENKVKIAEYQKKSRAKNKRKASEYARKYYAENRGYFLESCQKYRSENKVKIAEHNAGYYAKNKGKLVEYQKEYYNKNKERLAEYQREYGVKNEEKLYAHNQVRKGVSVGTLEKPGSCSICGVKCRPDGHHHDYSKPLVVTWVCKSCHVQIHKGVTKSAEIKRSILETMTGGGV